MSLSGEGHCPLSDQSNSMLPSPSFVICPMIDGDEMSLFGEGHCPLIKAIAPHSLNNKETRSGLTFPPWFREGHMRTLVGITMPSVKKREGQTFKVRSPASGVSQMVHEAGKEGGEGEEEEEGTSLSLFSW